MTEVFFYHLQRQPLEAVLPVLLQRCLDRGWRALVRAVSEERLAALDDHLWTFAEDSFLPHGTAAEPNPEHHPVLLTLADENRNAAAALVLVESAPLPADLSGFERVLLLFDGTDEEALAAAREHWRAARAAGHAVTYWQQDEAGRWAKKG